MSYTPEELRTIAYNISEFRLDRKSEHTYIDDTTGEVIVKHGVLTSKSDTQLHNLEKEMYKLARDGEHKENYEDKYLSCESFSSPREHT